MCYSWYFAGAVVSGNENVQLRQDDHASIFYRFGDSKEAQAS